MARRILLLAPKECGRLLWIPRTSKADGITISRGPRVRFFFLATATKRHELRALFAWTRCAARAGRDFNRAWNRPDTPSIQCAPSEPDRNTLGRDAPPSSGRPIPQRIREKSQPFLRFEDAPPLRKDKRSCGRQHVRKEKIEKRGRVHLTVDTISCERIANGTKFSPWISASGLFWQLHRTEA